MSAQPAIWQPMTTAPRDGTIVDLYLFGGGKLPSRDIRSTVAIRGKPDMAQTALSRMTQSRHLPGSGVD